MERKRDKEIDGLIREAYLMEVADDIKAVCYDSKLYTAYIFHSTPPECILVEDKKHIFIVCDDWQGIEV